MRTPVDTRALITKADEFLADFPSDGLTVTDAGREMAELLKQAAVNIEWLNGDLATAQDPEVAFGTFVFAEMEAARGE